MSVNIEDLQPKSFKVSIKGQEVDCKPPKLSHLLLVTKLGKVFENAQSANREQIVEAEKDFEFVIGELMPELDGLVMDPGMVTEVLTQIMEQVMPEETKALKEHNIEVNGESLKGEATG